MGQVARSLLGGVALALATAVVAPAATFAQTARWRARSAPASTPSTAAIDEARQRNTKALKLYQEEGAVEAALAEFERAYDLAPSAVILYNIGQAARTARDYALALHAYERYLADGGTDIRADRRQEVLDQIRELRTFVAWLEVRVDLAGARVFVDDIPVGSSPLGEKIVVNAGRVRVRAARAAAQDSKVVVVPGGDQVTIELALGDAGSSPAASATGAVSTGGDAPKPDGAGGVNPYLWIGWGAAGLLGVGAAITGGVALSKSSDLDGKSYAGAQPPDQLVEQGNTVRGLAIAADVLIGTAAASLVVTTILALAGVGAPADEPTAAAEVRWSLGPVVAGPDASGHAPVGAREGWGLGCAGRF
jgi:hypothetical protein